MQTETGDELELRAAADALGVHYQTAYRWVRNRRLPAQLVGGRYLVRRRDLDALDARRRRPAAPTAPSTERLDRQAEYVHHALLVGDEAKVRLITGKLVSEGSPLIDVIESVIVPPLRRIGQAWHDGELDIWVEHRASAIVERTLGDLAPNPRGRRRGTAVVAAIAGDRHSLPTTMAAVTLRAANWHVEHLGADMPGDELVRFCSGHQVDVAVLSVTNSATAAAAEETAERLRRGGTPTIVGGSGQSLASLVTRSAAALVGDPT